MESTILCADPFRPTTDEIRRVLAMIGALRRRANAAGHPLLLDLFCCGGGASVGYQQAGFDVLGVDLEDRSGSYPFAFVQMDAIRFVKLFGHLFDVVVGSPPCQSSSALTKGTNKANGWGKGTDESAGGWINLIPATREEFARLNALGIPTVIENVQGSDLRRDLTLCGTMFGLKVFRHRYFEISGFECAQPVHEKPGGRRRHYGSLKGWNHGKSNPDGEYYQVYGQGGQKGTVAEWQEAMGIPWLTSRNELAEAIPPAYSRHIGMWLERHLWARKAA
jgi:DNA (cytosine-5)-methyltransferase 1